MRPVILALAAMLAATAPAGAATLYNALGGEAGVTRVVARTIDASAADPRIAHTFDNTNLLRLKRLLVQQICSLGGGGCAVRQRTMAAAHAHLGLTELHFNALVENLQDAMEAEGVPFRTQNRLLALLAPMKREIVTR
jgi:hemoglobin